MPLISTVMPTEATGKVAEVYQQITQTFGGVPNAMQLYSGSPELLARQWTDIQYYLTHPTLYPPLLAMIRMLVSKENQCDYCIGFNAGLLINRFNFPQEQILATQKDPTQAPLEMKDKAMLLFVLKAVTAPLTVTAQDVETLKNQGWTEQDILDAVAHGARNVSVDIMFNTFKILNDF